MPLGRIPQSSYYDARNRPGAALYRARQPYLVRNIVTGLCIVGFVGGVCTYTWARPSSDEIYAEREAEEWRADSWTIRAIGQDDFSDIPIPDAPASTGAAPHMSAVKSAGKA